VDLVEQEALTARRIRDQDYFLLRDGRIVAAHGWVHPPGFVVGELVFVPDDSGAYIFFGQRYRKAYVKNGRGLPESSRHRIRSKTGSFYDNAHLFSTKSIVRFDHVRRRIGTVWTPLGRPYPDEMVTYVQHNLAAAHDLLGPCLRNVRIGLTGSLSLGRQEGAFDAAHDVDIMFDGGLAQVASIATRLKELVAERKGLRVHEHGKGWRIRVTTSVGLLCSFFSYENVEESPMYGLQASNTIKDDVIVRGRVVDDTHNSYLPTLLTVEPMGSSHDLPIVATQELVVVISHLRSRGDFFVGDIGEFRGSLIDIETNARSYIALSVVDGNSSVLLTPPWSPY
jgi:predicted nucleotidyltransferase